MKEKIVELLKKRWQPPGANLVERLVKKFTLTERVIFYILCVFFAVSTLIVLRQVSLAFSTIIPTRGGSLTEGIIGSPRFINPLLAISDADRDLTTLVYSGLMKATPDGDLVPDLAESYTVSNNGKLYTFKLKNEIFFQDGRPITADDVVFTIQKAEDQMLKSPKRADWDGVTVEKTDDKTVSFNLKQPYAPFLENTTIGLLPKHLWKNIEPDQLPFSGLNIKPVGSGPFIIDQIKSNGSGTPIEFKLKPFKKYAGEGPFIKTLTIKFYPNEHDLLSAYRNGEIDAMSSISPAEASNLKKSGARIERTPLPRIFGVFFNQNHAPILADRDIRLALNAAIDKKTLVDNVIAGYGKTISSPIPEGLLDDGNAGETAIPPGSQDEATANALKILQRAGWAKNAQTGIMEKGAAKNKKILAFSLSTSNTPELKKAAETVVDDWKKIGANVDLKIFESGDINQNVIRPRKYDALLFGEIIGRDLDLYAFWHSSQRNDPGLNIALYTNSKADKILETGRMAANKAERLDDYRKFEAEIQKDIPAVFLYSPDFLYVLPSAIKGLTLHRITVPSERFLDINKWYTETEAVWNIFKPKQSAAPTK